MLQWNCDSQMLVIMFANQAYACLYEAEQKSLSRIEIGLKVGCLRLAECTVTQRPTPMPRVAGTCTACHILGLPSTLVRCTTSCCQWDARLPACQVKGIPELKQWQLACACFNNPTDVAVGALFRQQTLP